MTRTHGLESSDNSQIWDAEDQALMDNDPTNKAIYEALRDGDYGAKHLGGNPNDLGYGVQENKVSEPTAAPVKRSQARRGHGGNGAGGATAGLVGAGVTAGLMAPVLAAAATGQGQQAGGGGTAAAGQQQGGLVAQMNPLVNAVAGTVAKVGKNAVDTVSNADAARKKWKGHEKRYAMGADGNVVESIRGQDSADANGFHKEIARDKAEKAVHSGVKTITSAAKGTSKIMDATGVPVSIAADVVGVNPLASAGQIAAGSHKMVKGVADVTRHQLGKNAARDGEDAAEERGDMLALGMHQAKVGHSGARNEAARQTTLGAMEATTGALGIAQFADPTGGTATAHAVMAGATKAGKKGNMVYNAVQKGLRWEEVQDMRARADQGDPEAMHWMLGNDPRTASGQMLMHAQTGPDDSKEFAHEHIANTLSLGEDGKRELANGKLGEFDKLYATRTGQDLESQLKPKEAGVFNFLSPVVKPINKFLGGGPKKTSPRDYGKESVPEPGTREHDQYFAREAARLSNALDTEKDLKASGATADEQAAAFSGVDRGAMPMRALPEVREYNKVKDFRLDKTYDELVDKAEQKSLKERFNTANDKKGLEHVKGKKIGTGELYNANTFASAEAMVDETYAKNSGEGLDGKADKLTGKAGKAAAMPYMKNKELPADVRAGLIAREEARRSGDRPAGNNLLATAPDPGWIAKQAASNVAQKETRADAKAAETLPGQVAKKQRAEDKAQAKADAKAAKADAKAQAEALKKAEKAAKKASG